MNAEVHVSGCAWNVSSGPDLNQCGLEFKSIDPRCGWMDREAEAPSSETDTYRIKVRIKTRRGNELFYLKHQKYRDGTIFQISIFLTGLHRRWRWADRTNNHLPEGSDHKSATYKSYFVCVCCFRLLALSNSILQIRAAPKLFYFKLSLNSAF